MQVKKFEARTMKEALEMVKSQLGPDAIILSARDNNKSFGLVGEGSVEITAAVSEETLQRKKFAESRLRGQDLEKFNRSPARIQKGIIEKMVSKQIEKTSPRPITARKYIEIEGEDQPAPEAEPTPSRQAVRDAVREAASRMTTAFTEPPSAKKASARETQKSAPAGAVRAVAPPPNVRSNDEIVALKGEIASLREIIKGFQDVPQNMLGAHPGADYGIPYDLSQMFEHLTGTGIAADIVAQMLTLAQENIPALKIKNRSLVEGWVARHILETTAVTMEPSATGFVSMKSDKIQVFSGPAGGGKTTALVKMASHLVVNEGRKVALLTTDTFKVGAADQMRIYAQILNVPFAIIRTAADWNNIMRYLSKIDVVLVDTPGLSLKDPEEIETLRRLMPPAILNPRVHFTVSATAKDEDVTEAARRYSVLGFDDAIFTGLDESGQHGTIYNFVRRFGAPLHAFGIGPRVPEDFEPATRERMLDLLFKITRKQALGADL